MSFRAILAASAVFAFAAPAFAQTPPPAPVAPAAASPDEAAFQAKAQAFSALMEQMGTEMQAALTAAAGDSAKANTDMDAIAARYQPEADTFASEVEAFMATQATTAEERAQMAAMGPAITAQIKGAPAMVKSQVLAAATAAAAPSVPQ
ncbi:translation initiation factor IF-2 [Brevundimonas sp.]